MSDGKTHVQAGAVVGIVVLIIMCILLKRIMTLTEWLLVPFVIFFYSQLPDIDSHSSTIKNIMFKLIFLTLFIMAGIINLSYHNITLPYNELINMSYINFLILMISLIGFIITLLNHRGWVHTIWAGIILSLPLSMVSYMLFAIGLMTYFSHLFMDWRHDG